MKTFFVLPFLMLLSALGLVYSPPPLSSPSVPAARVVTAHVSTAKSDKLPAAETAQVLHSRTTIQASRLRKTHTSAPATSTLTQTMPVIGHTSSPAVEVRDPASAPSASGLATGPHPRLTPTPTPAPAPAPSATDLAVQVEQVTFALTNDERVTNGLPALAWDDRLASLARSHSADMLANNYFSHTDKNGCSSSCRADTADYAWTAIGENIYMTEGYKLSSAAEAEMIVRGWMNSPGHRANILGSQFTHTGVGVAVEGDKVYITAMYAKPR